MNARRQMRRGKSTSALSQGRFVTALCHLAMAIALIVAGPWSTSRALAQQLRGSAELEAKLDTRGSITLRKAALADWVFAIKQEWGINIVSGVDLQNETVDGGFEDTPLREILSEILFVRGYGFQAVGNSLRIVTIQELGAMRPGFETAILPLDLLQPSEVQPHVELLISAGATVQSVPSSRSLIVIDTPEHIKKIQAHLAALETNARKHAERLGTAGGVATDVPGIGIREARPRVQVFPIQFLKSDEIVASIQTVVPDGQVASMKAENRLIVSGPTDQLAAAAELLKLIDVARQQVRITALLYDVDLEVMEQFGFNWSHAGKGRLNASGDPNSLFSISSDNFTTTPSSAPLPGSALIADTAATAATNGSLGGLATLSNFSRHFDLSMVIRVLDTTDGSRLLARPNVIAYDRIEAKFTSVSEIPVQQLTQTTAGGNIGTTTFREAGITLTVTPSIMQDGTVKMDVTPEFSVLAGFQSGQPIIDRRSATTTIHLYDGQTTVIGGLLRRNELENQSGLPGLSKIKYFGALFRDHDTTVSESELLVFIKAEIIPMGSGGTPRDEAAREVAQDLLDHVPVASRGPITPYCGDPYCPYHHPRPWGSALPPSACTACADGESVGHVITDSPGYYAPAAPGYEVLPVPSTSEQLPSNTQVPRPAATGNAGGPPMPVITDEARRRRLESQRTALRRLPAVNDNQRSRDAERTTPRLPSAQARPVAPPRSDRRMTNTALRPQPTAGPQERQPPAAEQQADNRPWWTKLFR